MTSLYPKYIKKRFLAAFLAFTMVSALALTGCSFSTADSQNKKFQSFTKKIFCQEVSSNSISLHYTLKNPEEYGIKNVPDTFGNFTINPDMALAGVENIQSAMKHYDYDKLSFQNRLTYDVLAYYLESAEKSVPYMMYEEPMDLVSGIQTQLPVLLSEYQFYEKKDVENYLNLMKTTPDYFNSLIKFEQEKSKQGLFMPDYSADTVIEQCNAFINMGNSNYLYSTFGDRLDALNLSMEEKSDYTEKNALMLKSYVLPAYSQLIAAVQKLKGTGKNAEGLCHFSKGKEYYSQVAADATGSERTVPELEALTRQQIIADLESMENVLGITNQQAQETAAVADSNPITILDELESKIGNNFPDLPETVTKIKYVPEAMQESLSPAFYMIPAIDDTEENVIYVNKLHMNNNLTLYTTLAHEGYPGHLYQTVYYAATNPDPLRSIFNFGGYVEGWATYAEMCSYYLAPLTKEQATLLQKNNSIILGLYALVDMGIHYDGWSQTDTIEFFKNYGIKGSEAVNKIYELIMGSPGNYLKYYIGYVEFMELKKEWVQEKGEDFSQKEFHEAVLSVGPAPFDIVDKYMWKMGSSEK